MNDLQCSNLRPRSNLRCFLKISVDDKNTKGFLEIVLKKHCKAFEYLKIFEIFGEHWTK